MLKKLFLLAVLASVIVISVPASAQMFSREVVLNASVTGPTLIVVDNKYLSGFKGLFVSTLNSCKEELPTWYLTIDDKTFVLFNATGGDKYYLCYGDIYVSASNLFSNSSKVEINVSVNTSINRTVYSRTTLLAPGDTLRIALPSYAHILNVTVTGYVYAPYGTGYVNIYADNKLIGSKSFTYYDGEATITGGEGDGGSVIVEADNLYIDVYSVVIYYRPYKKVIREQGVEYGNNTLIYIKLDGLGLILGSKTFPVVRSGTLFISKDGSYYVYDSNEERIAFTEGEQITLYNEVYGYDASRSGTAYVYLANPLYPSIKMIGPAYQVLSGSGGGGSNSTVTIITPSYSYHIYRVVSILSVFSGIGLIIAGLIDSRYLLMSLGTSISISGAILSSYADDYKLSVLLFTSTLLISMIALMVKITDYLSNEALK